MKTETKDKIDIACDRYKKVQKSNHQKFKKLDDWLDKESFLFYEEIKNRSLYHFKYKRGQLIKVDFGVNVGTEISHTHFAIVLSSDDSTHSDNITILPLTSKNGYKRINLGNLVKENLKSKKYENNTFGIITQIKTISKKRVLKNSIKYVCDADCLQKIDKAIIEYLTKT